VSFCPRTKADRAKKNFASVGLEEWVEFRVGDVLETLKVDPPREIDLILHVGAKSQACPTDCTPMRNNVPLAVDFQPLENTEFEPRVVFFGAKLLCPVPETRGTLLRSKWTAGKAVRAGLADGGSISRSIRDRRATQPPAHFHRNPLGWGQLAVFPRLLARPV
jgi:hypothetical protein